ncbi:YhgE/Pip domain-containing protein [Bacillus sp. REN16]|uniref:YhgE/Pip domain-containing protein n=1 Tax=Bacillus sp. REN16 TaxID=2887296 RepID=UPI001E51B876|nr:YhgE/Pip domain-containing protein [Bacillus sp. REN16]MCC3355376.1 YhgE/Pip domain-containing protein [Bacillus sp. REN16]
MNAFLLLKADLVKLTRKRGVLLSVIAVLLIPIVYAAILLSATWSPYDNLSNLPVAVVNLDKGAVSGDEPINVGEDLVASMKESMTLGFQFVSKEKADSGLENQDFYMVIEIPEDFSEKITTVLDESPQIPELRYIQNEGLNFMASQVTNSATERIREQLGNQITETYAKNLFTQLGEIATGFKSAADGSEQIHTGSTELHEGTTTMVDSLEEKAPDIDKLAAGAEELEVGTGELLNNLTGKKGDIAKLAAGAKAANDGTAEILSNLKGKSADIAALAKGSADLETGVEELLIKIKGGAPGITQLYEGAKRLDESSPLLKDGTDRILIGLQNLNGSVETLLYPGSVKLSAGVGLLSTSTTQLSGLSSQLANGLSGYAAHPALANDPVFQQLVLLSQGISGGITEMVKKVDGELKPGVEALANGIYHESDDPSNPKTLRNGVAALLAGQTIVHDKVNKELIPGFKQLSGGTEVLNNSWLEMLEKIPVMYNGASQIATGNQTVNTGWQTLTAGVTTLQAGTSQIAAGNADVNKGWTQLSAGAGKIHNGMKQVSDGTQTVKTGWGDLTNGATQINDGVGKIKDGSEELASGLGEGAEKTGGINASDANIAMFSSPVKTVGEKVNSYQYYRDSTAPYIISLALFVGMLIMSFIVDFKKPAEEPSSKLSWFASKYMQLSIYAIGQALLVSIFALLFLQLQVGNAFSFILFTIFVSMTFMTIIFFLVAVGGNLGRFAALAFIVLQLSITGANLPVEMLPENLRNLSQFLPLTYTNAGFKSIISLNDTSFMWANIGILFIYFAIFAVLALSVFLVSGKKQSEDMNISA